MCKFKPLAMQFAFRNIYERMDYSEELSEMWHCNATAATSHFVKFLLS